MTQSELRQIVRALPDRDRLDPHLPPEGTSVSNFISTTLDLLTRHGALSKVLFSALRVARPSNLGNLDRIEGRLLGPSEGVRDLIESAPPDIDLLEQLMDRALPWETLRTRLERPAGHFVATLFGSREQDLGLLCERIRLYVNEESPREHNVRQVDLRAGGRYALTAAEVESRFTRAAGVTSPGLGPALYHATRSLPALFVVMQGASPLHGMRPDERTALHEFLRERLPRALAAARLTHPVRVLLPAQHGGAEGAALKDELCRDLSKAVGGLSTLEHVPLPELSLPPWTEVEHQLRHTFRIQDDESLDRCRDAYNRARCAPDASYGALARLVSDTICRMRSPTQEPHV